MPKEFKSFFKEVKGNEGNKCHYPTRLDTYGCGCQHDCSYCADGDTNILMFDGTFKKLKDIEIGDKIYGDASDGKSHRFTESTVLNKWAVEKPSYKITLASGVELICSGDHRWLSNRGWKYTTGDMSGKGRRPYLTDRNYLIGLTITDYTQYKEFTDEYKMGYLSGIIRGDGNLTEYHYGEQHGRKTDDQYHFRLVMKEYDAILRTKEYLAYFGIETNWFNFPMLDRQTQVEVQRKAIRTHRKDHYDKIHELIEYKDTPEFLRGFIAGIYDAEGSTDVYIKRIYNSDEKIIQTVEKGLSHFGFNYVFDKDRPKSVTGKIVKTIRLTGGIAETIRFFNVFQSAVKRHGQLEGVAMKNPDSSNNQIVSIEPYKENQTLYDITTSTENFIANGVVSHNCYAKSLLDFRKLWTPNDPSVADVAKIRRKIAKFPEGMPALRLGGMTDCFQACEHDYGITYETIKALNEKRQSYLIVTKSNIVGEDKYLDAMDKDLAHIQVTVTCTDDEMYRKMDFEKAPLPSKRIEAIERLYAAGFDVQLRLSPFVPAFIDYDVLANVKCDKILVEFLRVNTWINKWFGKYIDIDEYSVKQSGYRHLPLEKKLELIGKIHGFTEVSVCEDESEAYEYWQKHFNPNPDDCCNLRK